MHPAGFNDSMVERLRDCLRECFVAFRAENPDFIYSGLLQERRQIAEALAGDLTAVGGSEQATRATLQLVDAFYERLYFSCFTDSSPWNDERSLSEQVERAIEATLAGVVVIHTPEGKVVKREPVEA